MLEWEISGGYELVRGLYAEGGVRRMVVDIGATILVFPEVKWKPGIWEPVIGMTYRPQLSKHWQLYTHVDAGGLGLTDDSTATVTARAEWRPARHFLLAMGYGFLYLRADGKILSKDVHLSQTLNGPMIGIGIPF